MNSIMFLAGSALCIIAVFLANFSDASSGFRAKLIHPASMAADSSNSTRSQRIARLVAKSHARVAWMIKNKGLHHKSKSSKNVASGNYESPLMPDGGGYVMELLLGTPPQSFKAIADTGSDLVWVQSEPCIECSTSGSIFHPTWSSTFRPISCRARSCSFLPAASCGAYNRCEYDYEYGSGSTNGIFSSDTLTLTATNGSAVRFPGISIGCGNDNDGFDGFEGLVGLGQGPISLTSQLSTAIQQKFSYCLVNGSDSWASSPIYFGTAASLTDRGNIQSTPIVVSDDNYSTYYVVTVNGFMVGGSQIAGSPGTTIVDSGTTITYVSSELYANILQQFQTLVTLPRVSTDYPGDPWSNPAMFDFDLCYDTSNASGYDFPSLTIVLDGAQLSPPASNYFLEVYPGITCLAMSSSDGLPVNIIGNLMQQNFHILFDRAARKISFAPQDCESL